MGKTTNTERFYEGIPEISEFGDSQLIELFGFYLHEYKGVPHFKPRQIDECFEECHLQAPSWTRVHLNKNSKGRSAKFLKTKYGYKLSRATSIAAHSLLGHDTQVVQTSRELEGLSARLAEGAEQEFLNEAISCFHIGANRATITMVWILTLDHLFRYVLKKKLNEFNVVLAKNADKRVKITSVSSRDDFGEMPESKFIEFCRSAKIISNDVRKILDQKLGIRNTSAHPSGVQIHRSKVVDFVEDLVSNVVLKYPI